MMKTHRRQGFGGQAEKEIYQFWEKSGYFTAKIPDGWRSAKKKPFVIVQPPPNVTGELHIGHALTATIQDILVRYHRMKGEVSLFLPGVDHAGIATQYALEKQLQKEGKTRFDLGREKFIERIWLWVKKYGQQIDNQHRRLGVSVDWSRKRFTLDKDYQKSVRVAFERLYNDGLIYKGLGLVNWCPRCQTAISDLENVHHEEVGSLYYLDYRTIQIATTRPETIFADVAVAVNPQDRRYQKLIGQVATIPIVGRKVPIIADDLIDQDFGTGALKITPAHDQLDHEIWQKHQKEIPEFPQIIGSDGRLAKNKYVPARYRELPVEKARAVAIEDLRKNKLLLRKRQIKHAVGHCQRCNTATEPLISEQWFVKMKPLADRAKAAVEAGKIKIIPKRFEKIYFHWLENIKDWTISRQIWWGHPIPIENEDDVLDTWFSSSLWPFASLGWPEKTKDFSYFYPTTILETGYDILFFWVARMIMMGLYLTGSEPFKTVLLHGMVRDVLGKKMSKTAGNVMDPLQLADKYGADALRMGLVAGTTLGSDMRLYEEKIVGYRNFATKLRNIARFVIDLKPESSNKLSQPNTFAQPDREIIKKLDRTVGEVTASLNRFKLHLASESLYHFLWHEFADLYIESSKKRRLEAQPALEHVLKTALIILHPFMPFVTEEIYQKFERREKSIMLESWPTVEDARRKTTKD